MQTVAVCCSVLQCVAVCGSVLHSYIVSSIYRRRPTCTGCAYCYNIGTLVYRYNIGTLAYRVPIYIEGTLVYTAIIQALSCIAII